MKQNAPVRRLSPRVFLLALAAGMLVVFAARVSAHAARRDTPGSQVMRRVGTFSYNNLYDPAFLTEAQRDSLTALRFRALGDAASAAGARARWQGADSAVQALYARPEYRGDLPSQQLLAIVLVKGVLLHAAPSPERDAAILRHVDHLVRSKGTDSATVRAGLAQAARTVEPARVEQVARRAAALEEENAWVAATRTCGNPAAERTALPPRRAVPPAEAFAR